MKLKCTEIYPRLILVQNSSQYLLASTFMRLQEFYESPYKCIKRRHFGWELLLDKYTKKRKFTYCDDYSGFNVPGNVVNQFFTLFKSELTSKEVILFETILPFITKYNDAFYLIGCYRKADIKHETAHGLYYLIPEYKKEMLVLIKSFNPSYITKLKQGLKKQGYGKSEFLDEIQAYAIDNSQVKFLEIFKKFWNNKG
jgi:hypothetical protein